MNKFWESNVSEKVKVSQLCLTLDDPMDYTVYGILQSRILEWVAFPFSRGSSQPRDWTQVSHIAGGLSTSWATREALGKSPTQIVAKCLLTLVIPTYIKPHYTLAIYTGQMNNKGETWCIHTDAHRRTTTHGGRYRFMECFSFLKIFLCRPFLKSLLNLL